MPVSTRSQHHRYQKPVGRAGTVNGTEGNQENQASSSLRRSARLNSKLSLAKSNEEKNLKEKGMTTKEEPRKPLGEARINIDRNLCQIPEADVLTPVQSPDVKLHATNQDETESMDHLSKDLNGLKLEGDEKENSMMGIHPSPCDQDEGSISDFSLSFSSSSTSSVAREFNTYYSRIQKEKEKQEREECESTSIKFNELKKNASPSLFGESSQEIVSHQRPLECFKGICGVASRHASLPSKCSVNDTMHQSESSLHQSCGTCVDSIGLHTVTQVRFPVWASREQFLTLGRRGHASLPPPHPTTEEIEKLERIRTAEPLADGGYKKIYADDDDEGCVWAEIPCTAEEECYALREMQVDRMHSALSALIPNFPRFDADPIRHDGCFFVKMPKYEATWNEYTGKINSMVAAKEISRHYAKTMQMSVIIQTISAVMAGQSCFDLHYSDIKSPNIMVDGPGGLKHYAISDGNRVVIITAESENGYGTVKLIDNSTTRVGPTQEEGMNSTTPTLTPLEEFVFDSEFHPHGHQRDVHNIALAIVECFNKEAFWDLQKVSAPDELFQIKGLDGIFPGLNNSGKLRERSIHCLYRQLVLLSTRETFILDDVQADPVFSKPFSKLEDVWPSKAIQKDVARFSLLYGSDFSGIREQLGEEKVEILRNAMWPSIAFRPTLSELLLSDFFEDYKTVLDKPEEQLRPWYEDNVEGRDDVEFFPLFLSENHVDMLFGDDKESFVLKDNDK